MSIDSTKKDKIFLIGLSHTFFTILKTYNPHIQKYKFIEELAGFVNDLSITC